MYRNPPSSGFRDVYAPKYIDLSARARQYVYVSKPANRRFQGHYVNARVCRKCFLNSIAEYGKCTFFPMTGNMRACKAMYTCIEARRAAVSGSIVARQHIYVSKSAEKRIIFPGKSWIWVVKQCNVYMYEIPARRPYGYRSKVFLKLIFEFRQAVVSRILRIPW